VAAESAAAGSKRVVLAGFSQGAAMALIAGLRYPERLGGIILYDPYTPAELPLADTRSPANADLPVWIGHGRYDWIIPAVVGEGVRDLLLSWGHPVSWREYHDYPNTHEPFSGAAGDLRAFLDEVVTDGNGGG
jgi:phospholipase/carboxylesterase